MPNARSLLPLFLIATAAVAQTPHDYILTLEDRKAHFLKVDLTLPLAGKNAHVDFCMPAWAPGAYQIANYAKFVQEFSARDEKARVLAFRKIDKQTWRVFPAGGKELRVAYRVFANLLSDVTSELNEEHAQVFGPQVFMYVADQKHKPVRLRVRQLQGWRIASGLEAANDSTFLAPNYDEFIDAPLEIGDFLEAKFEAEGATFRFVLHGEDPNNRMNDFAQKLKKIVTEQIRMMGGMPARQYVFIWHVDPRANYYGLEHLNSTSIGMPHPVGDYSSVEGWELYAGMLNQDIDLEYAAHEFFHLWNVKRIRPLELGPFDYTREVYTTGLWIAEGFTDYYGYLTLLRCGLWSPAKWLRFYSNLINSYRQASGRQFRSPSESSMDVWLWNYGEGEQGNLERTYFSYYPGGNLVGLCMDLRIRHETQNRRSLDEVMRALLQRFSYPKPGFTEEQFWQTVSETTGLKWEDFRNRYVDGTEALPFEKYLSFAGIAVDTLSDTTSARLGISLKQDKGAAHIAQVEFKSSADVAGLETGDRLIAIDEIEVTMDNWQELLRRYDVGDSLRIALVRRQRLKKITARMGRQSANEFNLSLDEAAAEEAAKLRKIWWQGYSQ